MCGAPPPMTRRPGFSARRRSTVRSRSAAMRAVDSAISSRPMRAASPKAQMFGMASVPARRPSSWEPPTMSGRRCSPERM